MNNLTGLTNALTDIVFEIKRRDLDKLGLKEGSHNYSNRGLRERVESVARDRKLFYAGSAANTMFNLSALGLNTALIGAVGNDSAGHNYLDNLKIFGVTPYFSFHNGSSGVCYVMITESRERTWVVDLGVSARFKDNENIRFGKVLHTTLFDYNSNPDETLKLINNAKKQGAKISLDLSDERAIRGRVDEVRCLLNKVDVVFSTDTEARALTNLDCDDALKCLSGHHDLVAMKLGARGAILAGMGKIVKLPATKKMVENTNGAGDAYASGVLYGYMNGMNITGMARKGIEIASQVCSRVSSHLEMKK